VANSLVEVQSHVSYTPHVVSIFDVLYTRCRISPIPVLRCRTIYVATLTRQHRLPRPKRDNDDTTSLRATVEWLGNAAVAITAAITPGKPRMPECTGSGSLTGASARIPRIPVHEDFPTRSRGKRIQKTHPKAKALQNLSGNRLIHGL